MKPMKKLTKEQKLALQIKKDNRIEKLKRRRKEKRKAKNEKLTQEQIARKKEKFQAKAESFPKIQKSLLLETMLKSETKIYFRL